MNLILGIVLMVLAIFSTLEFTIHSFSENKRREEILCEEMSERQIEAVDGTHIGESAIEGLWKGTVTSPFDFDSGNDFHVNPEQIWHITSEGDLIWSQDEPEDNNISTYSFSFDKSVISLHGETDYIFDIMSIGEEYMDVWETNAESHTRERYIHFRKMV